jgi:Tfp pilus assembly protein PilO
MYRLTKREKTSIGFAVYALVFCCFYVFVYLPKDQASLRLQEEIRTVSLEIERIGSRISNLKKMEEESVLKPKVFSLDKKSASIKEQLQQFLSQLANDAHKLDMDVISLELSEKSALFQETLPYGRLSIEMNIRCPYQDLGLYLESLGGLPGLVNIDGFQAVRDHGNFPKLQVKLMLTAYCSGREI